MKKLAVTLSNHVYDIHVGSGILEEAGTLIKPFLKRNICPVVTDENVYNLYGKKLVDIFSKSSLEARMIVLPVGETTKNFSNLQKILDALFEMGIERSDSVIAFGGGVVGDITGFAASIFRRGISFIQIPTTLLAQVDSAVGGKTGINVSHGKNLVGTFHQPDFVLSDVDVLRTLPPREFLAGYAEVVKYGLLENSDFFNWLDNNLTSILSGDQNLHTQAVLACCADKAAIVEQDTFEAGKRALLNLGHTFGHALEAATGYSSKLLHGEGVSIGIVLAFKLSQKLGFCSQKDVNTVIRHFQQSGMKTFLSEIESHLPDTKILVDLMYQDKKVSDGKIKFILTKGIGQAFSCNTVDMQIVFDLLQEERISKV